MNWSVLAPLIVPIIVTTVTALLLKAADHMFGRPSRTQAERKSALDEVNQLWDRLDELEEKARATEERYEARIRQIEIKHAEEIEELKARYNQAMQGLVTDNERMAKEIISLKGRIRELEENQRGSL